jgi:hypothetical protein
MFDKAFNFNFEVFGDDPGTPAKFHDIDQMSIAFNDINKIFGRDAVINEGR